MTSYKTTHKGRFGLSKTTETHRYTHNIDNAVVSQIEGKEIDIIARQGNITLIGSQATAIENITVSASKNILLDAAVNYSESKSSHQYKKSGITASFSQGIASLGYDRYKANTNDDRRNTSIVTTALNAVTGNLTVVAFDGNVTASATQLGAGKDIQIQGNNAYFNALTESSAHQFNQTAKSSGFGISMVYDPATVVKNNFKQQSNQGSASGITGMIVTGAEASAKTVSQIMNPGSPYFKAQHSQHSKNSNTENAVVGTINAGGNLSIIATEGNITTQGTQFSAEGNGSLWAKNNILLGVAATLQTQAGNSRRNAVNLDLSKEARSVFGAYTDKNLGEGESQTEQATVLSFGGNATLTAQEGNLTLAGTQAVANGTVNMAAGKDIHITTATTRTASDESQTGHAFGEVVVSETERFNGYNRKLDSQNNEQVSHQQALIASLNESVNINAGKDFHSTSGQILAKNRIDISGESVTFDAAHNTGESHSHQSDLRIGQFSRVSSPIIDLIRSHYNCARNMQ